MKPIMRSVVGLATPLAAESPLVNVEPLLNKHLRHVS